MNVSSQEKCAASTNTTYLLINLIIVILGSIGLLWLSAIIWVNVLISVSYFISCAVYFEVFFSTLVCKHCYYKLAPHMSQEEYLSQHTKIFKRNYRIFVLFWLFLAWISPILGMLISIFLLERLISLLFLIIFIIVATIPYLLILNKKVCQECKIRKMGICPLQRK